ncbi:MAG: peptidoglycan editing factor PgeF [Pseudomonadota bacterium]
MLDGLTPPWVRPGGLLFGKVGALSTTRLGGVSTAPYDGLNLGDHVGDDDNDVARNRALVTEAYALPSDPLWLQQVHGIKVIDAGDWQPNTEADAIVSRQRGQVPTIMTADCLPILLASKDGNIVGAAHAGWRGLAGGIVDAVVAAMDVDAKDLLAWIGPGIGPSAFEVGEEVREVFVRSDHIATNCFTPNALGRWQADLKMLAILALRRNGIARITDSGQCTYADAERFFSHRRSAPCGRMASMIWIL